MTARISEFRISTPNETALRYWPQRPVPLPGSTRRHRGRLGAHRREKCRRRKGMRQRRNDRARKTAGAASIATWPRAAFASSPETRLRLPKRSVWSDCPATPNFHTCISPSGSATRPWIHLLTRRFRATRGGRPFDLGGWSIREQNQIPRPRDPEFWLLRHSRLRWISSNPARRLAIRPNTPGLGRAGGLCPRYWHAGGRPANAYASGAGRRFHFRICSAGDRARQGAVFHLLWKKAEGGCLDAGNLLRNLPGNAKRCRGAVQDV